MFLKGVHRGVWLAALVAAMVAAAPAGYAAQKKDDKKQEQKRSKEEQQQIQTAYQLVDLVMAGKAGPEAQAFPIGFRDDFLKAQEGRIYVPFTISIDPAALTTPEVTLYLRVASRAAVAPAADSKEKKGELYAYEDVWFPKLKSPSAGKPYEISRAFAVPAGDYDVYVAIRERPSDKKATPKASVLKQPVTVPDYWNGELTTSSVIVADNVEQIPEMLSAKDQAEQPYTIGKMKITPALDSQFKKSEELSIVFLVYNPALKDNKPDVTVDYKFNVKTPDGEKYFNRTPPTVLNAETLPPAFDLAAGHQLVAGQSVPLASFPPGDYRLEIDVQDKVSQKTLTRDVLFTVVGP